MLVDWPSDGKINPVHSTVEFAVEFAYNVLPGDTSKKDVVGE